MASITVVGASGLIGSRVVAELRARGHRVTAASRRLGVDTVTGEGLDAALRHASVVVDVTNPGGAGSADVVEFFTASTRNLLAAEERAGVGHHVVLSIVGTDALAVAADPATSGAGYFRAKLAQEGLLSASPITSTIVRSTQFYEFVPVIADASTEAGTIRVPPVLFQPVAGDDVARAVADAALGPPANAIVELAGPERLPFEDVVRLVLAGTNDARRVVADPAATYFGIQVGRDTLVPRGPARLGGLTLHEWLAAAARSAPAPAPAPSGSAVPVSNVSR